MQTDNSIHLIKAARQRHEHTRAKAIAAMHELDRSGAVLTFASVARHAGRLPLVDLHPDRPQRRDPPTPHPVSVRAEHTGPQGAAR